MIIKTIVLTVYFSILLGIGFFASRRIKNISDYYVGGKKLNYWIAALSARSTGESGWLLIGVTGMGALMGVSAMWIVVGEVIGVFFSWQYMAKKFKRLTNEYNSITIPDFLVSIGLGEHISPYIDWIPLSKHQLGWVLPAMVVFLLSNLINKPKISD